MGHRDLALSVASGPVLMPGPSTNHLSEAGLINEDSPNALSPVAIKLVANTFQPFESDSHDDAGHSYSRLVMSFGIIKTLQIDGSLRVLFNVVVSDCCNVR